MILSMYAQWIKTDKELIYYLCSSCHWGNYYKRGEAPRECPNCHRIISHVTTQEEYLKSTGYYNDLHTKTTCTDGDMEDK